MNKIKTLIPLSEFVSKIDEICPRETDQMYDLWKLHQLGLITRYNNFLLQPLKIGMFFPADKDGNVYEDYKTYSPNHATVCVPYEGLFEVKDKRGFGIKSLNGKQDHPEDERFYNHSKYENANKEYHEAKSNVLFEAFTNNDNFKRHKSRDYDYWLIKFSYDNYSQSHTREQYEKELVGTHIPIGGRVEHLSSYGLILTEQAIKQIYG